MSAKGFLDGIEWSDDEIRRAWRDGRAVSSNYHTVEAPCRDTRVLTWIVNVLGADMLLDIIDAQRGGNLGDRGRREQARVRITEIGEAE